MNKFINSSKNGDELLFISNLGQHHVELVPEGRARKCLRVVKAEHLLDSDYPLLESARA